MVVIGFVAFQNGWCVWITFDYYFAIATGLFASDLIDQFGNLLVGLSTTRVLASTNEIALFYPHSTLGCRLISRCGKLN